MAALERESEEAKSLTLTLDKERQQTREEIAKQRDMMSGLQASLDREKRQVADLSSVAASMERNKAAAREELEAERQAAERTRESLETAQHETVRLEEVLTAER